MIQLPAYRTLPFLLHSAGKHRDWGLQELGRGFKSGVLHLKSNKGKKTGFKDAGPVRKMGGKGGKKGKKSMKMPI